METAGSLPCSQEPATGPWPEQKNPAHTAYLYEDKFIIIIIPPKPTSTKWSIPLGSIWC
jgi:hypothetical protein